MTASLHPNPLGLEQTPFVPAYRRGSPPQIEGGWGEFLNGVWGKVPQRVWAEPKVLAPGRAHGFGKGTQQFPMPKRECVL